MRAVFIFILYKTPKSEIERLKKEVEQLGLTDYKLYFIDNTKTNRGYAAGVNIGIRLASKDKADIFLIANPDIHFILRGSKVIEAGKYFDIWGFAMKQDGKTYYGGKIDPWKLSGGLLQQPPSHRVGEVDFVSGSLMVIKREVIEKIGLLDESYFMYYEDVDYCLRARRAGFKVGVDSDITYEHFEKSKHNPQKNKLLAEAHLKFFNKYANLLQRAANSRFLFNFFSLNLSSLLIKLFSFVNFLFLIRFLTTGEYGIYTLAWAQIGILAPLADFGTTSYGVVHLPVEKEKTVRAVFNLRIILSIIIFIATVILSILLFFKEVSVLIYILITSTVIFANMASGSYFIWNAIKEKVYISSRNSIIFNFLLTLTIVAGLVFTKKLAVVFLTIFIFYNLYTLLNISFLRKELGKLKFIFDRKAWLSILKKSYIFVLISFFAGLYFNLDVFLLNFLKGKTDVGIYSAGYKFMDALTFVVASYNFTSIPIFAKLATKGILLWKKVNKDLLFLAALGFGGAILTYILTPYILPIFLKGNYRLSIQVLQIVIFALPLMLLCSVFINVLYVFKKAYLVVIVYAAQTLLNFSLNLIFIPRFSYLASSYITVISEITNLVIFAALIIFLKKNENIG